MAIVDMERVRRLAKEKQGMTPRIIKSESVPKEATFPSKPKTQAPVSFDDDAYIRALSMGGGYVGLTPNQQREVEEEMARNAPTLRDYLGAPIASPNAGGKYSKYDALLREMENTQGALSKEQSDRVTAAQNELMRDVYGITFGQEVALPASDISDYETKQGYLRALDMIPKSGAGNRTRAAAESIAANMAGSMMFAGEAAVQGTKNAGAIWAMQREIEDANRRGDAAAIPLIYEKYKDQIDTPVSIEGDGGKLIGYSRDRQGKATYGLSETEKFLMETGISTANYLSTLAMTGGNPAFALGLMGIQAGANQMYAAGEKGVDSYLRQVGSGIAVGAIEAAVERLPLINLLKFAKSGGGSLADYAMGVLKQAGLEGGEEAVNYAAGVLANKLILGGYADDFDVKEMLRAAAMGATSGGAIGAVMGAPASIYNARAEAAYSNTGRAWLQTNGNIDEKIAEGIASKNADANALARELLVQTRNGVQPSEADIGKLVLLLDGRFTPEDARRLEGVTPETEATSIEETQTEVPSETQTVTMPSQEAQISPVSGEIEDGVNVPSQEEMAETTEPAVAEAAQNEIVNEAPQFKIERDANNTPYVIADRNILEGVPQSDWVKTVKKNLKEKFPDGVKVSGTQIKINAQTRGELTNSEYSKWLKNQRPQIYKDKLEITDNADEILEATQNYAAEPLNHPRKDSITSFARGDVLFRIGEKDYRADVVVAVTSTGSMVMYDLVNISPTKIQQKTQTAAMPKELAGSDRTPVSSESSVSQGSEEVKNNASAKSKEHEKEARIRSEILDYAKGKAKKGLTKNAASESLSSKDRKTLARVANIFGVEVTLVDSLPFNESVTNGLYQNGHIFIAKDREDALYTVLAHEITHHLERTAADTYTKYQDAAVSALGYDEETIASEAARDGLTAEEYRKEIAAYFTAQFIADPKNEAESRRRIMSIINSERSVALKVYNAIRYVINKLRRELDASYMKGMQSTLDYTEKLWRECLKEGAKNSGKAATDNIGTFDAENPDVNFSNAATSKRIQERMTLTQQNAELKTAAENLTKEVKAQQRKINSLTSQVEKEKAERKLTNGIRLKQSDIKAVAKSLVTEFSSEYDAKELEDNLTSLYNAMSNVVLRGGDPTQNATKAAKKLAKRVIDKSLADVFDAEDYAGVRGDIRASKLNVPAEVRADEKYKEGVRERMKGVFRTSKDGEAVDVAYSALSEKYPSYFPDDILTPIDQITRMLDVYEAMTPTQINPYEQDLDFAYETLAMQIVGEYFTVKRAPTFADKQAAKFEELRAKKEAEIDALKDRFKAKTKEGRKRQEAKEVRNKIIRHVKTLSDKLLTPTNTKHVPEEFRIAVAQLLEYINLESTYAYNIGTGKRQKGGSPDDIYPTKQTNVFRELKKAYAEILSDAGNSIVLDEELRDVIDSLSELENIRLNEMTLEQLNDVWDVVRSVEHAITTADKNLSEMKEQSARMTAKALISGIKQLPRYVEKNPDNPLGFAKKGFSDLLLMDMITPNEYLHMFGSSGDGVFTALRRAQDKYTSIVAETKKGAEKWLTPKAIKEYEFDTHKFALESGKEVTLSVPQIMSLYCLSRRDQAKSHLFGGGILVSPIKQKGKATLLTQKESLQLTENDLDRILSVLNKEEYAEAKKTADKIQQYMSSTLSQYGNEASMAVYGYEKFKEKLYFPIKTPRNAVRPKETDLLGDILRKTTIAGKGFAKQTKAGAASSVVVDDIFSMFADHVDEMATYSAYLAVIEDVKRLVRINLYNDAGELVKLIDVIDDKMGTRGVKYLDKLIDDVNTGNAARGDRAPTETLLSQYKRAMIAANLRVVVQQPTSLIRVLAEINPKYLGQAILRLKRGDWKKLQEFAPIAQWKAWGYYDIHAGRQIRDLIFDTEKTLDRVLEWGAVPMQTMDAFVWNVIYHASAAETEAKGIIKGSAAYDAAVRDRFNYLVNKTQVVDGILQRSQIARSDSAINRMSVSFMSEPLKTYNMLISAVRDVRSADDASKTAAKKKVARTVAVLITANVVNALMQSVVDAIRDDDRDKKYGGRLLKALIGTEGDEETSGEKFKAVLSGNITKALDPIGYIPYVKDVESLIRGYSMDRMDMESISLIVGSVQKLVKAFEEDNKTTISSALTDVIINGAALFGVPASSLRRDVLGVMKTFAIENDAHVFLYNLDKLFYKVENDKNLGVFIDTYWRATKNDPDAADYIYNDLIDSVPEEVREARKKKIRSKLDDKLKEEQGVESVKELTERAMLPEEKAHYDKIVGASEKSAAWKRATGDERSAHRNTVYEYIVSGEKAEDVQAAKRAGISENKYFEFLLAAEAYDEFTEEQKEKLAKGEKVSKALDQKEGKEAIDSIGGLSNAERAWLWRHLGWKDKNNPYK